MIRFGLIGWALVAILLAIQLTLSALRGGFFNIAQIALMLAPVMFLILINLRRHWYWIVLILIPVHNLTLPYYGLHVLSFGFLMLWGVSLVLLLEEAAHLHRAGHRLDAPAMLMVGVALIYLLRFLYDRPGIVGFGMERGGFSSALYATSAGWFFLASRAMFARAELNEKHLAILGVVTLLENIWCGYRSTMMGQFRWFQELADSPTWMSSSAILSLLSARLSTGGGWLFYLAMAGYLGLAVISAHRSRIFFVTGIVLFIAAMSKRLKKTLAVMVVLLVVALGGFIVVGRGHLPDPVARAFSLVLPERYWKYARTTGPMGWEDSFRTEMFRVAWSAIKAHPIFGNGLGFELEEALRILAVRGERTRFDMLALGKSYHNTYIMMATDVGVPAALAYIVATFMILVPFVKTAWRMPMGVRKKWCMCLIGFWLANFGMAMINGGHYELVNGCVTLGAMAGILLKIRATEPRAAMVSSPALTPTGLIVRRAV